MGFRRLTATEYNYIKELLERYHRKADVIEHVSSLSNRCLGTVKAIAASNNYKEYQHPAKVVKPAQKSLIKVEEAKPAKNYDGAILAEINRLRKDVNALTEILTRVFDRAGSDKPKQETIFTDQAPKAQG